MAKTGGLGGIRYANRGATRSLPLSADLVSKLDFLAPMGITMEVFSGGQPASGPGRTGSHRHDWGNAADVVFYKDGRKLDWSDPADVPVFQGIVQMAKERGVTGFGAGEGYMQPGSMHIGLGTPAVWGAGGKGANAAGWLQEAAGGAAPTYSVGPGFKGPNPAYVAPPVLTAGGLGAGPPPDEEAEKSTTEKLDSLVKGLGTPMLSEEEMLALATEAMRRRAPVLGELPAPVKIKRTPAQAPRRFAR